MSGDSNLANYDIKTQLKVNRIQELKQIYPLEINHHTSVINMSVFNSDSSLFATCSNDGKIHIYSGIDYSLLNTFIPGANSGTIKFMSFTKTGDKIVAGGIEKIFYFDVLKFQDEQIIMSAVREGFRLIDFKLSYGDQSIGAIWKYMYGDDDLKQQGQKANDVSIYKWSSFMNKLEPLKRKEANLEEFNKNKVKTDIESTEKKAQIDHFVNIGNADFQMFPTGAVGSEFTKIAFYLEDNIFYIGRQNGSILKYDSKNTKNEPLKSLQLKSSKINSLIFSDRYEFLIVCCNDSINLVDPESLDIFHSINTKHPVLCGKITSLLYSPKPKYHLIFAGGIADIDQARTEFGGNEVFIYNFASGKILTKLEGAFGNVLWIDLFKDGSGFITSGGEGVARVYRFDLSYYTNEVFV